MLLRHPNTVEFNPSNRAHRLAVAAFMKRNAWIDSPLRFSHDPSYGSLAEQVRVKMLLWYISRDVEKAAKPVKKVVRKRKAKPAPTTPSNPES